MNKKSIYALYYLLIVTSSLFIASCKKEQTTVSPPTSFDYFPTKEGHWVIYDVDSVVHADNDGNTDDSVHYYHFQVKELIASTFVDGEGRPTQRIERYRRDNTLSDWDIINVWTSTLISSRAERVEDNVRYIPLAFPINGSITWNGNAFNTLGEQDYTYESFHEPLALESLAFDSTLSVVRADDDNFVEKIYSNEKYAVHVGRIYKESQDLLKTGGRVVSGTEYTETVADYGDQ